ncbi:3,4-dihydroxy-2-butanone-4-phosphate synthase [Sphingomonas histidinilytica]|jgi:3,4-dihydroxy 2-butanone 4-phosphate synthase/GTP cyclohydrolase II|uniref:3,4-dihydroxy-2-butanone 4-phosphate synthase n=1 Tax=Rhizorhabdus histidinilytica TaxID=439228 RepID=A0A1T5FFY9_9SPHN|nr:3,4-dihydroxy-2-butanone-4-phosphate synthase [Rhizorhabdus histidinilytica]MBO9375674.1 3,4-dihydroxy-2-butanone-4-phosphate synthase [Rhizorhabdus histidinilytica]QEH81116.1 3,4-dihydroxy-2-butanone-4-phosphate synthase [Sphingomonas sp. C8-2]SKB95047.1 3,4-dihydroxy 2-butanone 4-phosphate synthase / GTP cyclohydrolase II [Rhizorhabdus histidinilytica]
MSTELIERIRTAVAERGVSRSGIARAAGLHPNSLRSLDDPDWNPTAETLKKLESYLSYSGLSPIEEIIDEARNGRMFILVDDEDRENEGDLIIPAQMATPDAINFMARYGRGLICLSMTQERVDQLGLPLMSRNNGTRHETAFTVSIEAKDGVTTGISAADRARTVAVAIDAAKGAEHIVTPGHVFPLVAKPGGVLVRAGHTEAAVDVARLAGLNPSGVICEIMNDDGTMARMDSLVEFARTHKLKIGTIRDLIAYRRKHDHLVERRAEARFDSRWGGEWKMITFFNKATGTEQTALVKGHIDPETPTLVRMHLLSPFTDIYGEEGPRSKLIQRSMEIIAEEGAGVIVILNRRVGGWMSRAVEARNTGDKSVMDELRDYGVGAQILTELGVHDMILLTNSHHTLIALDGYGLSIVGERPILPAE